MKWTLQLINNAVFLVVIHDTRPTLLQLGRRGNLCSYDTTTRINADIHHCFLSLDLMPACSWSVWSQEGLKRTVDGPLLPWQNEAKTPPAVPVLPFQASLPNVCECGGAGRSQCVEDICHNTCDLLAVCHPLCSDGPLPVLFFYEPQM